LNVISRTMLCLFLFIPLVSPMPLAAQAEQGPLARHYQSAADRLVSAALMDDGGYVDLEYLCDHIGKRISGSESLARAVAWSAQRMQAEGLVNVHTQPVTVAHWVRGNEWGEMVAPVEKPLHLLGLGMSVATPPAGLTAQVVVVPDFATLDSVGRTGVQGKIVVFNAPYVSYGQTVMYRVNGPSRAAALGAVGVLVRSITPLAAQLPHTGELEYDPKQPKIPAAAITIEDATMLARLQGEGVPVTVHFNMQARLEDPVVSANVIGELRGSEHPEQVVVVGGHVDSWDVGQGAQDDGSGIMAALAAVRLIRQSGLKPKRTIRLVFWVNEENGAAGGNAYFAALSPEDLLHHVAAIEMDGGAEQPIGWGYGAAAVPLRARPGQAANLPPPALSQGEAHSLEMLRDIGSLLRPIGASTIRQGGGGTDIDPLTRAGVPGLGEMTTDAHYFDWHHTEADTFDKVNLTEFRRNVGSMAVMTYVLADMPETLAGHVGASED
jgi:hypothetical protein